LLSSYYVSAVAGTTPQSATVGMAFATPLQALVEDSTHTPVGAGVSVTFLTNPPGGTFAGAPGAGFSITEPTNASGIATAPTFTASLHAFSYTVQAFVNDVNLTTANFALTNLPGPPTYVVVKLPNTLSPKPQYAVRGNPYGMPLQVTVVDANQNPVGAGVDVTFTTPTTGPSSTFPGGVSSVIVATDSTGTATAPTFTANNTDGAFTVTAAFGSSNTANFYMQNIDPDAVLPLSGIGITLAPGGSPGSVVLSTSPMFSPSTITGLHSLTITGNTDWLYVTPPSSGPLLPGPISLNHNGGGGNTVSIEAQLISGPNTSIVTIPGSLLFSGQHVNYGDATLWFNTVTAVDAAVSPYYVPPPINTAADFVQTLYHDELGRAGTTAEIQPWAAQVTGPGASATAVAAGIDNSFEARDHLVQTWYRAYLGRAAQNGEELYWANLLQTETQEQVLGAILGDRGHEFYNRAQTLVASGTPDQRYVQALYQVLLGRQAAGAEVAGWIAALPALGLPGIATSFLEGQEFRTDQFEGYYNGLLHRADDPAGLQGWLNTRLDIRAVRVAFEGGQEFFTNG
jgi:hypothetical protein